MISACGGNKNGQDTITFNHSMNDNKAETRPDKEKTPDSDGEEKEEILEPYKTQYLIVSINSARETMHVYRFANGVEYRYNYGMSTEFCNKYGDYTSVSNFKVGDVICLLGSDEDGKVKRVEKSKDVWVYEDVSKFSFDYDGMVLKIGDTNYKIDDRTFFLSGNEKISPEDISADDKLTVVGVDKNILSVSVTTGHGFLKLTNTELFDDSFLQLNTDIFAKIIPDMEMEVPEGSYTLTVANNGWGGTKEIEVVRGETLVIDLDEMKGEGPKKGSILFVVDVPAQIFIDNEEIDYEKPIEITYGMHSIKVLAEGYDPWDKTLVVNSKEATIFITLESTSSTKPPANQNSEASEKNDSESNSDNNSENNNENSSEKNSENSGNDRSDNITEDVLRDYLSTISNLLDSIH